MKKFACVAFCIAAALTLTNMVAIAQDIPPADFKPINGGVLNGKATLLPKPAYPAAAKAVGASGAVTVQVIIDEEGNVMSATAISGHPLLRAASVEAAKEARFSPTRLSGQPVKVAGVITYNFVGPLSIARVGFLISHAEQTGTFGKYTAAESLAAQLPVAWEQEKEILNSVTYEETVETQRAEKFTIMAGPDVTAEAQNAPKGDVVKTPPPDANRYTIKGNTYSAASTGGYGARKLDSKSLDAVRNLDKLVESRTSASEVATWSFEFGKSLGVFVAEFDNLGKTQSNLAQLESMIGRAPASVTNFSLQQAKEFVDFAKKSNDSAENRAEVAARAEGLSNMRY